MLRVANLSVSIGPVPIIRDATIDLREGEMCGLIGRNGAGKTTLLRALMGAIPATGKAELGHVDLLGLPAHRRVGHGVGYMPEDRRLVPEFTVEQNIRLPTWTTEHDGADQRLEWIFGIMGEVLANLKTEGVSVLIAESNEVHVADLLSRAFRIERGAVAAA